MILETPDSPLMKWLEAMPDFQNLKFQIQKEAAIRKWCLRDVKFKEGDRVKIVREQNFKGGWAGHEESLAIGQTGVVQLIDFNPFSYAGVGAWHADIVLDHEWCRIDGKRFETEPDRRHTWSIVVGDLEPASNGECVAPR